MLKLGFGLGLASKRNIPTSNDSGGDDTVYGAMIYYQVRNTITTQNNYEESLTATADLTYTVSVA